MDLVNEQSKLSNNTSEYFVMTDKSTGQPGLRWQIITKQINDKRSARYLEKSREFQVGDMVLVDRRNAGLSKISGSAHGR